MVEAPLLGLPPVAVTLAVAAPEAEVAEGLAEPVAAAPVVVAAPPETMEPVAPGFWPGTPVGARVPGLPEASVMVKRVVQALTPLSLVIWMK